MNACLCLSVLREIGRKPVSQLRICSWGSEEAGRPCPLALAPVFYVCVIYDGSITFWLDRSPSPKPMCRPLTFPGDRCGLTECIFMITRDKQFES